ncbi:MAG: outer membrane protein assembly factor BamA [Candidatus Krumholzibacteriia bacterium]
MKKLLPRSLLVSCLLIAFAAVSPAQETGADTPVAEETPAAGAPSQTPDTVSPEAAAQDTVPPAAAAESAATTPPPAAAGPVVQEIQVVGEQTVGLQQVLAWSGFETGRPLSEEQVARGIRRLFATKKFSDVFVYRQDVPGGIRLVINLREFPRIRSISFEGNRKIKSDKLRETFPVNMGQFANPAAIRRDLQPLRELYWEKGYYNVALETEARVDQNNLQDLVVTVDEGEKVKVKSIRFEGTDELDPDKLRDAMQQGTTGFLKSGTFKKQEFEADRERIVQRARDHGFLDFSITDVDLGFRESGDELDIVILVAEGPRYRVGEVTWSGNTVFGDLRIADEIMLAHGDVFGENDYLTTIDRIQQLYANQGYIYVNVTPTREIREQTVNVSFQIVEGEPAQVHDVQVVGNVKTHDNVILREMRLFPGDTFSSSGIMATQRDIFQLGYFEDVQPDFQPVGDGADIDIIYRVKERQTGQFMFGAAYSAQTSLSGFIQVAETNFRGKGQNVSLSWQFGSRRRYVDLSFTEPWFLGTPTLAGVDLFDRFQYNFDDFYESRIRGFALRTGRRIPGTRFSRIGLRYELSETRLSNFSGAYVRYLDSLESSLGTSDLPFERLDRVDWPRTKSALRLSLQRNSTDNPFFPTTGSKTLYTVELAGGPLGGEIDFQEHLLSHSFYQRLPAGFTLHLRGYTGLILGLKDPDSVPDYEKYRLGGNRLFPLRGYKDLEVVPRGNPGFIGGRFFTIFNSELLYAVTPSVHLLTFLDMGDAWNGFGEADFANMRKGAGFGVRVEVPMMGTIGFDYGYGFDRLGGGAWEPHFNIGTFF